MLGKLTSRQPMRDKKLLKFVVQLDIWPTRMRPTRTVSRSTSTRSAMRSGCSLDVRRRSLDEVYGRFALPVATIELPVYVRFVDLVVDGAVVQKIGATVERLAQQQRIAHHQGRRQEAAGSLQPLAALHDAADHHTQQFLRRWGQAHHRQVIEWFERALQDLVQHSPPALFFLVEIDVTFAIPVLYTVGRRSST